MSSRTVGAAEFLMKQGIIAKTLIERGIDRKVALNKAALVMDPHSEEVARGERQPHILSQLGPSFSLAWAECGFPMLEPSHSLAASLMCTSISQEAAENVILPWRCFGVRVPVGLLTDEEMMILIVRGHSAPDRVQALEIREHHIVLWHNDRLFDFADLELKAIADDTSPPWPEEEWGTFDEHQRSEKLAARLVLGVCLELDDPERKHGSYSCANQSIRMKRGEPKTWTFQLTRPVEIDVRKAVRAYVTEGNKAPTVQTLVRGHHKRQPHGPGGTLRKWIQIEPYWRGPEDAPIAVRRFAIEAKTP